MKPSHKLLFLSAWLCFPVWIQAAGFPQPAGIYVLDSSTGYITNGVSMRDANIRSNDFVSGYVLRAPWASLETNQNQFDFTIIDWNVRKLAAINKNLSLEIINVDPPWLAQMPGVMTWYDTNSVQWRAVPWDPFLLGRVAVLLSALAEHQIDGVKLKDHPVLTVVNFGLAGADLAIRDPASVSLYKMTNYSRANITNAVLQNLLAAATNFPSKLVQIGFWPITDNQATPSLWEFVRESILAEFNGVTEPRVGFWMENLAASRPAPGTDPVTGAPTTTFAAPEFLSQTNTWVGFQALTSWLQPFTGASKVTNGTPADGIQYANTTFGSSYFEIYAPDIDSSAYRAGLEEWHARFFPPDQISIGRANSGAVCLQWPSWPGGLYQVEASTNLLNWTNSGASQLAATNITAWTNTANLPAQFYRLRTLP